MTRFDRELQSNDHEIAFESVKLMDHIFLTGGEEHFNRLIFDNAKSSYSQSLVLAHHNLHSLFLYERDENLRAYMQQTKYIWIDGMAVLWIVRLLGYNAPPKWRLTFLDWQHSFFTQASLMEARIFLLGSRKKVIEKAAQELSTRHPKIKFAYHHGYVGIQPEENRALIKAINDFEPDILLVGMGMPKQESWIRANQNFVHSKVIMPLGGYFDYIGDATYTPPRISGRFGLEWLFRFAHDPQRLYGRYLIEPWFVILNLIKNRG